MAKATKEEFRRVWDWLHPMEALFDGRGMFSTEEDWRDWPDDDPAKKELLKIEKEVIESDGTLWDGKPDNDRVLFLWMKRAFLKANYSGSIGRILFDCETLIANACDPKLDYIEFKPSIMYAERNTLAKVEKIITRGEEKGRDPQKIIASIKKLIEKSKQEDE